MLDSLRIRLADYIAPELATERRNLERAANTDPLTGIANRRAFDLALAGAELDPNVAILVLDANSFGQVNKQRGQDTGDHLLRSLVRWIVECASRFDLAARCFRIGGDEFAILVPCALAGVIRDQLESRSWPVSASLTVSLSGTYGATYQEACATLQARKRARKSGQVTHQDTSQTPHAAINE